MMAGFYLYRFIPDSFSEEAGKWLEIVLLGCNNVGNQHKVLLENGGEDFENLREEINSVISNVSDIVSVVQPSGLSLVLSYQLMESRVKTLNSDIGDYEETHQNDTQNMDSMIESIRSILIAKTGSPAVSVTNYQAGSIARLPSYQRLQMGYEKGICSFGN